jgi:hypothetical protein
MTYTITEEDRPLRRIIEQPHFYKEVNGMRQLSSAAFKLRSGEDGLSVDIMALTTLEQAVPNRATHTAAILPAHVPLSLKLPCVHDSVLGNSAHALIQNVRSAVARQLAMQAVLL